MVTLTEVEDEHFQNNHPGQEVEEDDDYSDTGTLQLPRCRDLVVARTRANILTVS